MIVNSGLFLEIWSDAAEDAEVYAWLGAPSVKNRQVSGPSCEKDVMLGLLKTKTVLYTA